MLEIMCFVVTVILVTMFFGLFLRLALLVAGLFVICLVINDWGFFPSLFTLAFIWFMWQVDRAKDE